MPCSGTSMRPRVIARRGGHAQVREEADDGSAMRIEDYGLICDMQSAALVGRNGSIDWLCLPRFDSPSCFTALPGDERHGRWLLAPPGQMTRTSRRYRAGPLVLETEFETANGTVRVTDFMPRRGGRSSQVMRIVDGLAGRVPMRMEIALRADYGAVVPWVDRMVDGVRVQSGPDAFHLSTPLEQGIKLRRDMTQTAPLRDRRPFRDSRRVPRRAVRRREAPGMVAL
jgi:GH15 family glucan-1,4-alpha-glucosidase